MASLMEELLDVLGEEEQQYQVLIALSDIKRQAVIKADIARLGEVTVQEQGSGGDDDQ